MAGMKQSGFTVIELMLFLGVSGALFAALMTGVNMNIGQQRYKESVTRYASLLENQYSEAVNVRNAINEGDDTVGCQPEGATEEPIDSDARGTSPCVILGRAVQVRDGVVVETTAVLGIEPQGDLPTSDLEVLKAYSPRLLSDDMTSSRIDWQSSLVTDEGRPSNASFLILRSPISGLIRVFAYTGPLPGVLSAELTPDAMMRAVRNCMEGDALTGPMQSVTIDARVAGPAGVIVNEADMAC